MLEFIFDSARTASDLVFAGVLSRHPNIQWIFTHGGGALPLLAGRMELFRTVFGVGPDEASAQQQMRQLWFDMAGTPFPNQIPTLVDAFGSDHLLYGSDYCWTPAEGTTAQVASLDTAKQPDGETWRALTTRNARRLFPRYA
jgi:predicted TIM-barrel fold metal-dependent hydrolase